jgi:hypothetical protein
VFPFHPEGFAFMEPESLHATSGVWGLQLSKTTVFGVGLVAVWVAAREKIVGRSDEEGRPPESVFDIVQGITAVARTKPQQDARLVMEGKAKVLLEKAA